MPNINTAIVNLFSKESSTVPSFFLIMIFCILILSVFSQRIFNVKSQYFTIIQTTIILLLMLLVIMSLFVKDTKLMDNQFMMSIDSSFNNPSSRNFISVITLILFIILIYELTEYDNNNPNPLIDKLMFGYNNYISNRFVGISLIIGFGIIIGYTVATMTRL